MIKIDFSRLRFLTVDDNANMRRILRAVLQGFGARDIFEAEDGNAGLRVFRAQNPDIILSDWSMPSMPGIEFVRQIRQSSEGNPFVPIIMVTAHSERPRVERARNTGVTEFLCKPVAASALYERVVNVVANPRPFVRTKTYFGPDRRRKLEMWPEGKPPRRRADVAEGTSKDGPTERVLI